MKKSIIGLALSALLIGVAAHADTAPATAPAPNDLFRFDITCNFGSVGCSAESRIFLNIRGDNPQAEAVNPEWFGNLLSVSCRGQLISASDALLFRQNDEDGVRWEIFNADQTVEIDLKDHPFSDHPKDVNATLEIRHGRSSGTCHIEPKDVHGLN